MKSSKIVIFGLQERAITLKNQRKSNYEIASILAMESGKSISRQNVDNYFRTHYLILKKIVAEDAEFKQDLMRQLLDANAQLILDVDVVATSMGSRRRWVTTPAHYFMALLFAYVGLQKVEEEEDWMNIRSRMNMPDHGSGQHNLVSRR